MIILRDRNFDGTDSLEMIDTVFLFRELFVKSSFVGARTKSASCGAEVIDSKWFPSSSLERGRMDSLDPAFFSFRAGTGMREMTSCLSRMVMPREDSVEIQEGTLSEMNS
jgi:hypothetical protein